MHTKIYLEGTFIFNPCPASPSLNTETRVILLKTQVSIQIFRNKKVDGQDTANVDGY